MFVITRICYNQLGLYGKQGFGIEKWKFGVHYIQELILTEFLLKLSLIVIILQYNFSTQS
jgi:hypothetical protein